ncbi:MAG: FAD-dependent oxidoreductase, partial [Lacipirellulaceae bacterium]
PGLSIWGLQFLRNASKDRHRAATQANYLLSAYSKYLMDELRGRLDLDYDSSSLGTMKVFPTEEAMGRPIAIAEMLKSLGLRFEILDREETIKVEPQLGNVKEKIAGALRFPDDGSGDAHLFALAIAQQAVAAGGEIRTGVSVRRLLADGARITGVETAEGPIQGSRVILANGVFAPQLALSVGVRLPIKPAKGYSATLDMTGFKEVPKVPIIDDAMHAAVVPLGTRLRFAGTAEFTGYDTQIRQDRVDNLFGLFERLYPDLAVKVDRNQMQGWAGLRPISADGKAFIGESRIEGLWINAGHGHLGWTMAVGSAALLVDLMSCERPRVDVMPFSPRRIS